VIGKTLAHYEVVEKIGAGGMGEVYRARDTKLDRDVALKVLPADLARQTERRMRFEREAKAIAGLSHPNIVTIHSVEHVEGIHFLTMELVQGQTLDRIIPPGGMPLDRFLELGIGLADAVSAAHRSGITHRDLKPGNIMVDRDGRLKILDFGLAKLLETETPDEAATMSLKGSATGEGRILGTAAYMSPEQAEGKLVDHRSDIFSLGIVLYEMATGQRPFRGDTQMSTLSAILREDPASVTELRGQLPRHLGRIVRRCLQKDRERRYQSAADLRNDLQELREEISSGQLEVPAGVDGKPSGRGRWVMIIAGAAAVAVIGYGLVRELTGSGGRSEPAALPTEVTATTSGEIMSAAISPDASYVVFVLAEDGRNSMRVKQLASGSEVEILPPEDRSIRRPRISTDGQDVFFFREATDDPSGRTDIYRVPLLGGNPQQVIGDAGWDFALSPDGKRVAFLRSEESEVALLVANLDGSGERRLRSLDDFWLALAWSPTGKSLLCTLPDADSVSVVLGEIDVSNGDVLRRQSRRWTMIGGMQWGEDGRIFLTGLRGGQRFQDASQVWLLDSWDAEPRPLTGSLADYQGISLDRSGTVLATTAATQDQATWLLPATRPDLVRRIDYLPRVGRYYKHVAWTRDSRLLLEQREGGVLHIRALSIDGLGSLLLTKEGPLNMAPAVSPDGRTISFASNRDGNLHIYLADIGGSGVRRATTDELPEFASEFGRGGDWLYYDTTDASGEFRIRRVPVAGGDSELLTHQYAARPRISPDGKSLLVYFRNPATGQAGLAIVPAEGGESELLDLEDPGDVLTTQWYPDGKALTVPRWDGSEAAVWIVSLDGSEQRKLVTFPLAQIADLAWNAAGDSLAVVTSKSYGDVVLLRGF